MDKCKGRALIADQMGLGKSIESGFWIVQNQTYPALIVCPASLKENWRRELLRLDSGLDIQLLNGQRPSSFISIPDVFIINYDILWYWKTPLSRVKLKTIVFDESHKIKNKTAKRTKAAFSVAKGTPHILCLSGTPILSRPYEIYSSIRLIQPDLFPSFGEFASRFCGMYWNSFKGGYDYSGASNTKELHKILTGSIMIRRTKAEVLKDLPAKRRMVVPLELNNQAEYDAAFRDIVGWVKANIDAKRSKVDARVKVEYLRQICVKGKLDSAVEWIRDYLEDEEKLVVFAIHKKTISTLTSRLSKYNPLVIDGSVAVKQRQGIVDSFQKDPKHRVILCNIQAGGVGCTLTAAKDTCFVEAEWTPGENLQAEDRVHRISQKADSVGAYYLVATGTIEEKLCRLLDHKMKVVTSVLDGSEVEREALLTELLKECLKGSTK